MAEVLQAQIPEHLGDIRELFWEYLQWANGMTNQEFGVNFDIETMLEGDLATLEKFSPPDGRLLLAEHDDQVIGLACMRKIAEDIGEIKRMYVRPPYRRLGIGRALLDALIEEAHLIGYGRVRLDSARFMEAAHQLYRTRGFEEIAPYAESEIPQAFWEHWVFMEKAL